MRTEIGLSTTLICHSLAHSVMMKSGSCVQLVPGESFSAQVSILSGGGTYVWLISRRTVISCTVNCYDIFIK